MSPVGRALLRFLGDNAANRDAVWIVILDTIIAMENLPCEQPGFARGDTRGFERHEAAMRLAAYDINKMVLVWSERTAFGHAVPVHAAPMKLATWKSTRNLLLRPAMYFWYLLDAQERCTENIMRGLQVRLTQFVDRHMSPDRSNDRYLNGWARKVTCW